ncbi:hypothetical protein C468_06273 [Halorubrum kocurii JCM 14978]|uniref:Glucosamine inositolphosphorylceramide transferase 1 N-terminal domain-containing protein n=2 Tax=Halorubrum kocurii TaxID=478441 RepID=M0P9T0_9EURY|nr:hypothetical protein C468_06273 [Halorubrum kocurii JCM 14978]
MAMSRILSAIKRRPVVVRTAWWAGKIVNHRVPRLLSRALNGAEPARTEVHPPVRDNHTVPDGGRRELPEPTAYTGTGENPVLVAEDVTDFGAVDFVADPFLFPGADCWHLFFEVCNTSRDPDAVIAHATSPDGLRWEYDRVVLRSDEHLSFPYVFEWEGTRYMVPEEGGSDGRAIRLYEATDFPGGWEPRATLVSADHHTDDTVVFRWRDRWWLLVGDDEVAGFRVYHSDSLVADDWEPHEGNPVVTGRPTAFRPGGRPVVGSDGVVVFFQDCEGRYGEAVRAFEITALGPETYADEELTESPVLEGTGARVGWNSGRMHHVDPWCVDGRWLCMVDGNVSHPELFTNDHWSIGVVVADSD